MLKILFIEDDEPKLLQISAFLSGFSQKVNVAIARSLNTACKYIDDDTFDIILLDMSLPTFDGGKTQGASGRQKTFGGKDILMYLWELEISTPVWVVTQFKDFPNEGGAVNLPELHSELIADFPENYKGLVYFEHSNDRWKTQLTEILR
jgi:hypothetical protein